MKRRWLGLVVGCTLAGVVSAEPFFLVDKETDQRHGPFELKHGAVIALGNRSYLVQIPEGASAANWMTVSARLSSIKIPEVGFRQAPFADVMEFIKKASIEFDNPKLPEKERGINFVLNIPGVKVEDLPLITFSGRNLALVDLLKAILQTSGLKHRVDGSVVYIEPKKEAKPARP